MIYLLGEIALWMVLAAALGLGIGWLVWGWLAPRRPSKSDSNATLRNLRTELASLRDSHAEVDARLVTVETERDTAATQADEYRTRADAAELEVRELRGQVAELQAAARAAEPDDLKQISGVGPKLERLLHRVGIRTFRQLAELDDAAVDRLDSELAEFKGRIRREGWVEQAKVLQATKYSDV